MDTKGAEKPVVARTSGQKGSAVTRVLDILEAVALAERPITPSELYEQLDIPKATVHRLCVTLEEQGYLQSRISGRGLLPGPRFHATAVGVLASSPYRAQRKAILSHLSEQIGETCNISIPDGNEMIYFERVETHSPVRVQLNVGSRVPAYCTSAGKMYLSSLPAAKRQRILDNTALQKNTDNTIVQVKKLLHELELTAERGYALDNEEYIEGMVALAVPVTDSHNRLYATLSCHAPCMRVSIVGIVEYLPKLVASAEQLSQMIQES